MKSCTNCGSPVTPEDRFCGNCGLSVPGSAPLGAAQRERAASSAPFSNDASDLDTNETEREPADAQNARPSTSELHHVPSTPDLSEQLQPTLVDVPVPQQVVPMAETEAADAPGASESLSEPEEVSAPESSHVEEAGEARDDDDAAAAAASSSFDEVPEFDEMPERRVSAPATGEQMPTSGQPRTGSTDGRSRGGGARQLEAGTVLNGRYEIVRKIGGGGMGAVYYAKDRNLGDAPRAVKEMIQSHIDESQQEKAIADFKRESMLLASLEHPSIPTIYDYFYDDEASRFYLVMKYISGGDFLARLRNAQGGRIEELTVADWAAQVADVLDYLHNQRPPIIYRDLKPANLMIDGNNGRVMLIDFGIARWVQKEEKGVTAVGTMGYAPPELFSGKVEPRSDIYSLGATMFHLLTGSDPQDQPLLVFDFTKNPRPREINPAISNEMDAIISRAVEYQPESRFRSAAEMRDVLLQHSERLRAGAVTYGAVRGGAAQKDAQTLATEMVYCGFCGKAIAADDVFCAHCGARQPIVAASASLRAARATARLVVSGTTELDATFMIHKESTLVGRTDPQSNIFPDVDLSRFDPETKISRRHARIYREGDTFLVEDLGSVNGTVVNDSVRLGPRQPRRLVNGDRLRLGETTLHFIVG